LLEYLNLSAIKSHKKKHQLYIGLMIVTIDVFKYELINSILNILQYVEPKLIFR